MDRHLKNLDLCRLCGVSDKGATIRQLTQIFMEMKAIWTKEKDYPKKRMG